MKLYKVEFMEYTNPKKNCVKDENKNFLNVCEQGCYIQDKDLELYKNYGGGFRKIEYVGELL